MGHYNPVDSECILTITKVASCERPGFSSVTPDSMERVRIASVTSLIDAPQITGNAPIPPTYCSSLRLIVRCHLTDFPDQIALQSVFFVSQAS